MSHWTESSQHTLKCIAWLTGEPDERFTAETLQEFMAHPPHGFIPPTERDTTRGLKGKTLPSLIARGYVRRRNHDYELTEAGFDKAMELTGGLGLL